MRRYASYYSPLLGLCKKTFELTTGELKAILALRAVDPLFFPLKKVRRTDKKEEGRDAVLARR